MAVIPVEKKSASSAWMWLAGLLVLLVIIWFIWQMGDRDGEPVGTAAPVAVTEPVPPAPATPTDTLAAPAGTAGTGTLPPAIATAADNTPAATSPMANGAVQPSATAPGERVTDAGIYSSTSDKLALVGREAVLSNVRVARIVGPKSFTLASGSVEFLVMVDQDLNRGVGTQGQIDPGSTIDLKGRFQRLQQDEIEKIAGNRFRELTEQEREWLRKTPVYLHATEFGKIS